MDKNYRQFLYEKIHEISEQKESFCRLNNDLQKENESLKKQLIEQEELVSVKDYIKESLEITDEELNERFGEKTEEEKFAKYLLEIIKRKNLDPKQVISIMQTKVKG